MTQTPDQQDIGDILGELLLNSINKTTQKKLTKTIQQYLENNHPNTLIIKHPDNTTTKLEHPHKQFAKLCQLANLRENILLVGPTGSGKTTAARQLSNALKLSYETLSLGPTITETRIFGYQSADGTYIPTPFRRVYEDGGVFLFDEFDAGNPNVLTAINSALDNGHASFPDKLIERHPDAIFICSANTYGRGADRLYVGRNQLDAATLERFIVMDWEIDEQLEYQLAQNDDWVGHVQELRQRLQEQQITHIISPRASIKGAKLLKDGFTWEETEELVIWKGLDENIKQQLTNPLPQPTEPQKKPTKNNQYQNKIDEIIKRKQ